MRWLLADGRARSATAPWIATFTGLAIALSVLACNLLRDMPREAPDPRLRRSA
jgi:ABC-type dipeptide/oligopeptide/nickel transport system permease subunit